MGIGWVCRASLSRIGCAAFLSIFVASCYFALDPTHRDDVRSEVRHLAVSEYLRGDLDRFRFCQPDSERDRCRGRSELIENFLEQAIEAPADPFVRGQVVHSLVRMGAYDEALSILDPCPIAEHWWCRALEGHVLAERGQVVEAQSAFDYALRLMPESVRCEWTDLSPLMSGKAWSAYKGDSCVQRLERLDEFWWLADPAWTEPGNDREVEHYNRMAWGYLHAEAYHHSRIDGSGIVAWHHGVVRFGRAKEIVWQGWTSPPVMIPHRGQAYRVIPDEEALLTPFSAGSEDWPIEFDGWLEHYVPTSGGLLGLESYQVAFFERGDSLIATAAVDVPDHPEFRDDNRLGAVLFLGTGPADTPVTARTEARDGRWLFRADAPRRRYVMSIEATARDGVGRIRMGHGLPHAADEALRLSDLLLFAPGGTRDSPSAGGGLPDSLDAALPLMRGSRHWPTGEVMGVYLEAYGAHQAESLTLTVELEKHEGLFARIGHALGLGQSTPFNVEWSQPGGGGRISTSFTVDLRDTAEGDYTLRVSVGTAGAGPVTVEKSVRIERS